MGYLGALAFAGAADRSAAVAWHLSANCYPPLPGALLEPCLAAIDAALDDDWDREIPLPADLPVKVRARPYSDKTTDRPTAARLIECCHLEAFLDAQDDDESEG